MRTPAEHKVFQWICWEKKYGKPVFKIFWYGRSDRFYPGNAGDVFLVNLDCVHAWNFSGTRAGADEISRKKAGSPREPDLDGSTSGRHRTAHIDAFEKKRSVWGASMGIYDQRNGDSPGSDHHSDRLWNGIFICGPHGAFDPGVCQDDGS